MPQPVRMLFICVENANRSQMAAAFAHLHGGGRVEAYSAGSKPAAQINPKAIAAMREVGYDLSAGSPKSTADLPDVEFDFVATMGCGDACPNVQAEHRADWNIPDPRNMSPQEFNKVRDLIEQQVLKAFETIGQPPRINFNRGAAAAETAIRKRLTFTGGGWVLALAAVICLAVLYYFLAPLVIRQTNRPPGDGANIDSYGFDLSNLQVPRDLVYPAMLYRDMAPAIVHPTATGPTGDVDDPDRWKAMQKANDLKYGKYMVGSDLVIGVTIDGESRAYPLHVMYVHEIINDTLAGVPIAVTHHWPCDSVVVFDRRIGERIVTFHISGIVYNSNMLMYERLDQQPDSSGQQESDNQSIVAVPSASLWSQLLGRAISGPHVGTELKKFNAQLQRWDDWAAANPETTVLNRNLKLTARYKQAAPTEYVQDDKLLFPAKPLPVDSDMAKKTPIVAIELNGVRRVYSLPMLADRARQQSPPHSEYPTWTETIGTTTIRFALDRTFKTVRVDFDPSDAPVTFTHAYWFAWHAMYGKDDLASD